MQHNISGYRAMREEPRNLEDEERRAELHAYFDLAWEIFVRLEREGKLPGMDLTNSVVNPTVNAPKGALQDQLTEPT